MVQTNNVHESIRSEYKESNWGKQVDGQFVVDGYKYKGRQSFGIAKEGLKDFLLKGSKHEIDGIKFRVLDVRQKGIEHEIEIEVEEDAKNRIDHRGIGIVKLYGPNKRKEYVVTVTKCKDSDIEFVQIVAQSIVKPCMNKYLDVNSHESMNISDYQTDCQSKCVKCDKVFNMEQGVKIHMSKIHTNVSPKRNSIKRPLEVNKDIEILIENVIGEAIANGKKENKEVVLSMKCNSCSFTSNDQNALKVHQNNQHTKSGSSTSPPQKKQRSQQLDKESKEKANETNILEDMDYSYGMESKVKSTSLMIKKKTLKIPNLFEIPKNIKHLV